MGFQGLPRDGGRRVVRVIRRRGQRNHLDSDQPSVVIVVISIPDHREIDRKLQRAEIRKAGLSQGCRFESYLGSHQPFCPTSERVFC